ncbi:MAG: leucine-rich repeat protein [Treponema sp.]|nr:leucine-rich repeat protein [Treponema sp.]
MDKVVKVEQNDTTPPAAISSDKLSMTAGDSSVLLLWTNPSDEDFYGTRISFTPTVENVSQPIVVEGKNGATSSVWVNGLSNEVEYTFSFVALDDRQNDAEKISKTATPKSAADKTPPSNVTNINTVSGNQKIVLSWENPADDDFYGVWISEKNNAGTLANPVFVKSPANTFIVSELENAVEYEFSIIAIDNSLNQSQVAAITASSVDTSDKTAPSEVTELCAVGSESKILLSWENPADEDFYGVWISEKNNAGTLTNPVFVKSPANTFIVSELENDIEYEFSIIAIDNSLNQSLSKAISASPVDTSDTTAPSAISAESLTAVASEKSVFLEWENPGDEDFYGTQITFSPACEKVSQPIIVKGSSTQNASVYINGLENDITYTFTLVSLDKMLNESQGVSVSAMPVVADRSVPMKIELTISEELSNTTVPVTVKVTSTDSIKKVVYKRNGSESPAKLLADSEALPCVRVNESDDTLWTFFADEKDWWTVASLDEMGREETAQIYAKTIDKIPPTEVTNVNSTYIKSLGKAEITWNDPADSTEDYDSPFDHVLITYTKDNETEIHTVEETFAKGNEAGLIGNIDSSAEFYVFTIHTVDKLGNVSEGKTSPLYIPNVVNATADDVVTKINEMTQSGTVKVTGDIDGYVLSNIVTAIKEKNFEIGLDLEKTTGVTSIQNETFKECTNLTSVVIPEGVTYIGIRAFKKCISLRSVVIPDGVTSIEYETFRECTSLISVIIPEGVTSIVKEAFCVCTSLTRVEIPESVTAIGKTAFSNCTSLTSVVIPNGVTSIEESTFYGCSSLTNVTIPESVTTIGVQAFSRCTSLTSVTIPEGVTSMGTEAFSDCTSLTSVVIPDGVTSIGAYAFKGCVRLTSATIPEGVTAIGPGAFENCTNLPNMVIPKGIVSIRENTFAGCIGLTSVGIPDGVASIGGFAFSECTSLTSIVIPEGCATIGGWTFSDCTSLTSISFNGTVEQWNEIEKGWMWNSAIPATKVICSDGEVDL